jgi:predicted GNAT family acetyltransferase
VSLPAQTLLKNFVWHSLTNEHRHLALANQNACRYLPDVSPFAALKEQSPECLNDLATLVSPNELILLRDELPPHVDKWKLETQVTVLQMISVTTTSTTHLTGFRQLVDDDIPAMLELTQLVLPGYFLKRSIEMGTFFGVFDGNKLIAMTGERMFPSPYREITAVCTHPDYQGRGYASKLVQHSAMLMIRAGLKPFLHTAVNNVRAIELYRRLGFIENDIVTLSAIRKL